MRLCLRWRSRWFLRCCVCLCRPCACVLCLCLAVFLREFSGYYCEVSQACRPWGPGSHCSIACLCLKSIHGSDGERTPGVCCHFSNECSPSAHPQHLQGFQRSCERWGKGREITVAPFPSIRLLDFQASSLDFCSIQTARPTPCAVLLPILFLSLLQFHLGFRTLYKYRCAVVIQRTWRWYRMQKMASLRARSRRSRWCAASSAASGHKGWQNRHLGGLGWHVAWYSMVWYGMVWYGMVWYGMVWYGMVWYGMVWYGMVWYGMVWYGMVWYDMLLL